MSLNSFSGGWSPIPLYRWTWIWQTQWDQKNWSVICKICLYIWWILDMHRTGTKHIVLHMFTCITQKNPRLHVTKTYLLTKGRLYQKSLCSTTQLTLACTLFGPRSCLWPLTTFCSLSHVRTKLYFLYEGLHWWGLKLIRVYPYTLFLAMFHLWCTYPLTLPMLRLLSSKEQRCKYFWKPSKPCHVGIHWIELAEYSQMSTHLPGFLSFFRFLTSFCIGQISHQQHKG